MALSDRVIARYPDQYLRGLTNRGDTAALIVDATVLALAVEDVEALFQTHGQVEYDDTDKRHVQVGVRAVIVVLQTWKMTSSKHAKAAFGDMVKSLEALKKVTSRARIEPVTSTKSTRTSELDSDGTSPPPRFDKTVFDQVRPDSPIASSDDRDD